MDSILFDIQDGLAIIRMNRPDKLNSFNRDMALLMQEKLDTCAQDPNIRAVLITGEGRAFCAGQDLAEAIDPNGPGLTNIVDQHYNPMVRKIAALEKPVLAAVNGVAAGAGANLALACDIVVATQSASFIQAFSAIGLVPDTGGTYFLPRLIGWQKASALMMLGDKIKADQAEQMNMIYKSIPDEEFEASSLKLGSRLAKMPTRGLALTKKTLQLSREQNLDQQLDSERDLQTEAGQTHDYQEGVNAFLEKRKPTFKGA